MATQIRSTGDAEGPSTGHPDMPLDAPRREFLYRRIMQKLEHPGLQEETVQYELARWVALVENSKDELHLQDRARAEDQISPRLLREVNVAVAALVSDKPELVFARSLRQQVENRMLRNNGWLTRNLMRVTDGSPVLTVCLGAFLAALLGMLVALFYFALQPFGIDLKGLVPFENVHAPAMAGAAFLGGLVSMLSRLQAFSKLVDFDQVFLFFNAFFKPFVGVIFGFFAFAALSSDMLPLDEDLLNSISTSAGTWAIGFIAGFSERFANDLISRGGGMFAASKTS